jgi:ABC-2 type transport system permease protein
MWRVVAARDFQVRLRDKGFLISTGITLTVISVLVLIRAYGGGGGTPSYDLGYIGEPTLAARTALVGKEQGVTVRIRAIADETSASQDLHDGSVDAVLEPGPVLVSLDALASELGTLVQVAAVDSGLETALSGAGFSPDEVARLLHPPPVPERALRPTDPNRETNAAVALVLVLLLYGQLFGYGVWVATGVIEEKASRVVEILLSAIHTRQLLAGKILGIGALGLAQLVFIATCAIGLAAATGALKFPAHAVGAALIALCWFMLGFAFYASLFAAAGSLVSRMEDLQNAIVPLNLLILASFFISIGAVQNPDSTLARVASIVPFSSALAMPVRIALGSATLPEIVVSLLVLIGSAAALVPISARLYSGAILRTGGKVKVRDAWRAAA